MMNGWKSHVNLAFRIPQFAQICNKWKLLSDVNADVLTGHSGNMFLVEMLITDENWFKYPIARKVKKRKRFVQDCKVALISH